MLGWRLGPVSGQMDLANFGSVVVKEPSQDRLQFVKLTAFEGVLPQVFDVERHALVGG